MQEAFRAGAVANTDEPWVSWRSQQAEDALVLNERPSRAQWPPVRMLGTGLHRWATRNLFHCS
jgi:hypothetical protein